MKQIKQLKKKIREAHNIVSKSNYELQDEWKNKNVKRSSSHIACADGYCKNITATCPNVKPYADGLKRTLHTEVKCNICHKKWIWGLSWNGSRDGQFYCGCK